MYLTRSGQSKTLLPVTVLITVH